MQNSTSHETTTQTQAYRVGPFKGLIVPAENEVAKLHHTGLAKNFHTNGKYVGCFIAPGSPRITCPGVAKLS